MDTLIIFYPFPETKYVKHHTSWNPYGIVDIAVPGGTFLDVLNGIAAAYRWMHPRTTRLVERSPYRIGRRTTLSIYS